MPGTGSDRLQWPLVTTPSAFPEALAPLSVIAYDLRATWDREAQVALRALDPEAYGRSGRNPVRLLREADPALVAAAAADSAYVGTVRAIADRLEAERNATSWYDGLEGAPRRIAYLSPEFGLTELVPQYSGGLGVLAGDHLKAASDLGVPIVGVGLFYRGGYFRQSFSAEGAQQEHYPELHARDLPLQPAKTASGADARIELAYPGEIVHARILQAQIGRVLLLLLDTDVPENGSRGRAVTDRLYGGDNEHRLRQEILLGVGGIRALAACGIETEVVHTNEGHAGFQAFERVRVLVEAGAALVDAFAMVRETTVFTTHTPVPAGIDRFPRELMARYFGDTGLAIGLPIDDLLGLGAEVGGDGKVFNMAVLGMRMAARRNGVSRLHGRVSRAMFAGLWPGTPTESVPIGHITNGVHAGTWVGPEWDSLLTRHLGPRYGTDPVDWDGVHEVADDEVWKAMSDGRARLVAAARRRLRAAAAERGDDPAATAWIETVLDPDALTIGFARRVPTYKRLTLILRERERLTRLLRSKDRPVQLVIAGKSHPADQPGKALIRELATFALDPAVRGRIVMLPNYGMELAALMVAGVDVWLNNPLRPYEACGTSGMKAALNGVLNLSILDGWWDEMYDGRNGWAIPSAEAEDDDPDARDAFEASALLDLLEDDVVPLYYNRPDGVLPEGWIARVKHSVAALGPQVLASRMVRDYCEHLYLPAAGGRVGLPA